MPFPDKYKVEFYQPQTRQEAAHRILLVCKAYVRDYVPMASSNALRYSVEGVDRDQVMVACLIPHRFWWCLTWVEGRLDIGSTLLNVLSAFTDDEKGVSLGCYDLSCEIKIVNAFSRHVLIQDLGDEPGAW